MNNFNYKEAYDDLRCRIEGLATLWDGHFEYCLNKSLQQAKECGERWANVDTDWDNIARLNSAICKNLLENKYG